jgi:hypothetical protein
MPSKNAVLSVPLPFSVSENALYIVLDTFGALFSSGAFGAHDSAPIASM